VVAMWTDLAHQRVSLLLESPMSRDFHVQSFLQA
jgi:hypothetical protein